MGTFQSKKHFKASPIFIPQIAKEIETEFTADGYQTTSQELISGGYDISITKGGVFKAVLGLKTALKVHIYPSNNEIEVDAGIGIFGQQALPAVISMFFLWPVLITQITGMIKQSQLDDKVMNIAQKVIMENITSNQTPENDVNTSFCYLCGNKVASGAMYCSSCGERLLT